MEDIGGGQVLGFVSFSSQLLKARFFVTFKFPFTIQKNMTVSKIRLVVCDESGHTRFPFTFMILSWSKLWLIYPKLPLIRPWARVIPYAAAAQPQRPVFSPPATVSFRWKDNAASVGIAFRQEFQLRCTCMLGVRVIRVMCVRKPFCQSGSNPHPPRNLKSARLWCNC